MSSHFNSPPQIGSQFAALNQRSSSSKSKIIERKMKFTTAAQVLKVFGGLAILSSQAIIGVEAGVSSIVCHHWRLLLLFPLICALSMETLLHTNLSLYIIQNDMISPTLLSALNCSHTRFSFVHHHRRWVYYDNISLCTHLFSFICSWLTLHQLFSALNWCTLSFLLRPSQNVSALWSIISFCTHPFSLIFTGDSHCTNSSLLWTGAHSRFSFVHHSLWVYYDNISLCTHLFSFIRRFSHCTNSALLWTCFCFVHHSWWVHYNIISLCTHLVSFICKWLTFVTLLCFELCAHTRFSFVHHRLWVHHDIISLCTHLVSFICKWLTFVTLLCFELCAHSRFSFVHHRLWVHHDNISLCAHLVSFICEWLTLHQSCAPLCTLICSNTVCKFKLHVCTISML